MMMKLPSLSNTAPGCPKNVLINTTSSLSGKKQIEPPTNGCGLAKIIIENDDAIQAKNKQLMEAQNTVQNAMYGLIDDETALQNKLSNNLDQMNADLSEYGDVNNKYREISQELVQAKAMSEDTKLQLVSDNYNYLLWSILAIALVIGGIRASRN